MSGDIMGHLCRCFSKHIVYTTSSEPQDILGSQASAAVPIFQMKNPKFRKAITQSHMASEWQSWALAMGWA